MMLTWRHVSHAVVAPWRHLLVLPWQRRAQPIAVEAQRYGYAPWRFWHRGELFRVCRVEQVWEIVASRGQAPRRYFSVQCANACSYTLFQDLRADTWHMEQ